MLPIGNSFISEETLYRLECALTSVRLHRLFTMNFSVRCLRIMNELHV